MRLTAAITAEDEGFVARCLEADVVSQGDTIEEASANLIEAVELHYEGESVDGIMPPPVIMSIEVNVAGSVS